jgi:peptide deformylase
MKQTNNKDDGIAQLGNPILKQKAEKVENILSDECQQLINQMMDTVKAANGVGIAAPQIHQSLQIFIMCSKPNIRYPDAPLMEPTAVINPEILNSSHEKIKDWEGCLSVPSLRGLVPRHQQISVRYSDQKGNVHQKQLSGFIARIFQHEFDHLNGLTFIDQLESSNDLMSESEWYQQYATTPSA